MFNVPNPPPRIDPGPRKSLYKNVSINVINNNQVIVEPEPSPAMNDAINLKESDNVSSDDKISKLIEENENLRQELLESRKLCRVTVQQENEELIQIKAQLAKLLNTDQQKVLKDGRVQQWSNDSIIKALKFRFALSIHGYEFLRNSGYPLPAYSTVMRKIQDLKIVYGIFDDVLELLKYKVQSMEEIDKFAVFSYDEMWICEHLDYDKNTGKFFGNVTLGNNLSNEGQKIFLVVVRGIKNRWKQAVACHVTPKDSIDQSIIKKFMLDCISRVEECGLRVLLLSSDLDGKNRSLWTALNIQATKTGLRVNSFLHNNHDVYVMPDPCHLLKNLKSAMLRQIIYLPAEFVEMEKLPTNEVDGSYVVKLWNFELSAVGEKRLLHHIKREDVEPSNFDKMNVGAAIRFFSPKTAGAIKTAVEMKILPENARTTAEFILIVDKWFSIISSKLRKTSITSRNCDKIYIFLHSVIDLFQNTVFQAGWKPLNYGFVLATLTFCDLAEYLFLNKFDFVLGDRFLQDGTENIFSQIRKRYGKTPTALQCLQAIKGISVSQFISDCKRTSYMNDSDEHLIDFCAKKRKIRHDQSSSPAEQHTEPPTKKTKTAEFNIQTYDFNEFSEFIPSYEANSIFYLAGSTTNSVIKHVCEKCGEFLKLNNLPSIDFINKAKFYTKQVNKGGLKEPCEQTLRLVFHCEYYFNLKKSILLRSGNCDLIRKLYANVDIEFPKCCNVKYAIIKHFFNVRSFCVKNYYENYKPRTKIYASASAK